MKGRGRKPKEPEHVGPMLPVIQNVVSFAELEIEDRELDISKLAQKT